MHEKKRKLLDLIAQRKTHLDAATAALEAENREEYDKEMQAATAMNDEIAALQNLLNEQDRFSTGIPMAETDNDAIEDLVGRMRAGQGRMELAVDEVRRVLNSTLIGTDSLAKPTRVGTTIHDNHDVVSALLDRVTVVDMQGCSQWDEPYVKAMQTADAGTDGSAPTASDPTFRVASIKPVLVDTLSYVSRHINNLTPVAYADKVKELALKALKRKIVAFITNGDGSTFYGLTNATNTKSEAICKTYEVSSTTIGAGFLRKLVLSSGGAETTGSGVLLLKKADLIALGDIRGTNELLPVFEITPDEGSNGNYGTIKDGGLTVDYIIDDSLTALSTATQGASAIKTMVYADLSAYILGLFGNYTVEVSKDYKFAEGLLAIRGEVMAGGNLSVHEGAVVVTLAASNG